MRSGSTESGRSMLTLEPVTLDLPVERSRRFATSGSRFAGVPTAIWSRRSKSFLRRKRSAKHTGLSGQRRKLIRQDVHLVELDLLVKGIGYPCGRACLRAISSRWFPQACGRGATTTAGRCGSRCRDPAPVLAPDPDVILDLPALFTTGYDRGRYARSLDYSAPLDLPLAPADRTWAKDLARPDQGLRDVDAGFATDDRVQCRLSESDRDDDPSPPPTRHERVPRDLRPTLEQPRMSLERAVGQVLSDSHRLGPR